MGKEKIKIRTVKGLEEVEIEPEEKRNYKTEYNTMQLMVLEKSVDMDLKQIIINIEQEKEYIFDFIKHPTIVKLSNSIKSMWKFNQDEAEDALILSITEYFYENNIDTSDFDEEKFLMDFRKNIKNKTQKQMRNGYSAKEYPSCDWSEFEEYETKPFEEDIDLKVDIRNMIDELPFSQRDKYIFKLNYIYKYTERELSEIFDLGKSQINNIIIKLKEELKNIL